MEQDRTDAPVGTGAAQASPIAQSSPIAEQGITSTVAGGGASREMSKVSKRFIALMVLAASGANIAFITPLAISLALRVQQLAPDNEEYLGVITGLGATLALVAGPLVGMLSDRTRSRWGRRAPWMLGGALVGTAALALMAAAPSVPILAIGWCITQVGWGTAAAAFFFIQADRIPESQRGSVAGLMGFAGMAAPVIGAVLGSMLVFNNFLLFLVPGAIGFILVTVFSLTGAREDSSKLPTVTERLTPTGVAAKYVFNPRKHPDFGWNWLGRFLFTFGLTLNTTFATFFIAQTAGTDIAGVAGIIALVSLLGVSAAAVGALGGGWLSDRIKRRKVLVLASGIIFAIAAVSMAFAPNLPTVLAASVATQLAVGIFSSIDNAILLDIIPDRAVDAGRYSGIAQIAVSLGQAAAPLIAAVILVIGVTGSDKNYTLLFLVAAVITLFGGLTIFTRVKGSR